MAKVNLEEECASQILGEQKPAFDVFVFKNLLDDEMFKDIERDVGRIKTSPKNNDLYKFEQSEDLLTQMDSSKVPSTLLDFSKILRHDVRLHLEKISGLKLSATEFDITVSRYHHGDYLLCHNDDIKDASKKRARALAFVFYLSSCDPSTDGGALTLYKPDDKEEPIEISHKLSPRSNSLVVFKTTPISWHCVEEVFKHDRVSINGWFHLAEPTASSSEPPQVELCPYNFVKPQTLDERMEKFFGECINQQYMMNKTCYLVRRKFKKASEINLPNFLVKEKYEQICEGLKKAAQDDINLHSVGPYNKRHYKRLKIECLPQICRNLLDAFKSDLFFMMLSRFTGLDLQPPNLVNEDDKLPGDSSDEDPEDMEDEESDDEAEDEEEEGEEEEEVGFDEESERSCKEDNSESTRDKVPSEPKQHQSQSKAIGNSLTCQKREHGDESSLGESSMDNAEGKPVKRRRVADPLARLEFRHLEPGSYTLIHDYAYETHEKSALDVILHFNHDFEVCFEHGGYISYLDISDDDSVAMEERELLTVEPKSNCLSLVYREAGTGRFLKHINKSHVASYQDLYCVYYEKPSDLPSPPEFDDGNK